MCIRLIHISCANHSMSNLVKLKVRPAMLACEFDSFFLINHLCQLSFWEINTPCHYIVKAFHARCRKASEQWTLALKRFENCFAPRQSESFRGRLIQKRFPSRKLWLCFLRGLSWKHARLLLSLKRLHALQKPPLSFSAARGKADRIHPLFPLLQLPRSLCRWPGLLAEFRGLQLAMGLWVRTYALGKACSLSTRIRKK